MWNKCDTAQNIRNTKGEKSETRLHNSSVVPSCTVCSEGQSVPHAHASTSHCYPGAFAPCSIPGIEYDVTTPLLYMPLPDILWRQQERDARSGLFGTRNGQRTSSRACFIMLRSSEHSGLRALGMRPRADTNATNRSAASGAAEYGGTWPHYKRSWLHVRAPTHHHVTRQANSAHSSPRVADAVLCILHHSTKGKLHQLSNIRSTAEWHSLHRSPLPNQARPRPPQDHRHVLPRCTRHSRTPSALRLRGSSSCTLATSSRPYCAKGSSQKNTAVRW